MNEKKYICEKIAKVLIWPKFLQLIQLESRSVCDLDLSETRPVCVCDILIAFINLLSCFAFYRRGRKLFENANGRKSWAEGQCDKIRQFEQKSVIRVKKTVDCCWPRLLQQGGEFINKSSWAAVCSELFVILLRSLSFQFMNQWCNKTRGKVPSESCSFSSSSLARV